MTNDAPRLPWNWENPQELSSTVDEYTVNLARCDKLELIASAPVFTRAQLRDIGITGIEFAVFKTAHPQGLGTDLVSLRTSDLKTQRNCIYRIDGDAYFIELDISEPLPFETGSVDWVYAEHLIEHVSLDVGVGWLTEVRRILTPGGLLRLSTPDLRTYARSYVNGDSFFTKHRRRISLALSRVAPPMPSRAAFMFNQLFYVYGHRWIYDLEELQHVLIEAGFEPDAIRPTAYREGARTDIADLDQVLRNDESIYIEAAA